MNILNQVKQTYDPRDQLWKDYTTKDAREAGFAGATRTTPLGSTASTPRSRTGALGAAGAATTIKSARVWQSQESEVNPSVRPPFLDNAGKWVPDKVPGMVVGSQAQPLTAPGAFTATGTLRGSQLAEGPKAIAAVYTYSDVSPAVNTECQHDALGWAGHTHKNWDPTVQKLRTARLHDPTEVATARVSLTQGQEAMLSSSWSRSQAHLLKSPASAPTTETLARSGVVPGDRRDPEGPGNIEAAGIREASIANFWKRAGGVGGGGGWKLGAGDLARTQDDLNCRAVPASHNARLVGSRWKYMERPVVGQALYTDFYGPVGGGQGTGDYYGRSWHHVPQ